MKEKVLKVGVKKDNKGYLYFLDKQGDIARTMMARAGKKAGKQEKVFKAGVQREKGYMYFIDGNGDVSRAKMSRGGQKKTKKTVKKPAKKIVKKTPNKARKVVKKAKKR
ncbi:MAG: hypothetical protein LBH29_05810 [Elusimicrobiota bacterium]|nr:hypothetical protein [Elusimicrobiota bacterium]